MVMQRGHTEGAVCWGVVVESTRAGTECCRARGSVLYTDVKFAVGVGVGVGVEDR